MNVERLKQAIKIIEAIPDQRFDLLNWSKSRTLDDGLESCGMVACAGGWLSRDPDMNAQNLMRDKDGLPAYEGSRGFAALARFFDISYTESWNLFECREEGRVYPTSDKQLWLLRANGLLQKYTSKPSVTRAE